MAEQQTKDGADFTVMYDANRKLVMCKSCKFDFKICVQKHLLDSIR